MRTVTVTLTATLTATLTVRVSVHTVHSSHSHTFTVTFHTFAIHTVTHSQSQFTQFTQFTVHTVTHSQSQFTQFTVHTVTHSQSQSQPQSYITWREVVFHSILHSVPDASRRGRARSCAEGALRTPTSVDGSHAVAKGRRSERGTPPSLSSLSSLSPLSLQVHEELLTSVDAYEAE